jgi:hypothetical protein
MNRTVLTPSVGAVIVHRDVDSQKGKDKKHDNREVFGIWLQEYGPGWEDLLPVQRLRALVVLRSRYRGEAVRVQEGICASVGCSRRSRCGEREIEEVHAMPAAAINCEPHFTGRQL